MQPFETKDGRQIIPVDHQADFTGRNNSSKSKVLIYLNHVGASKYLTARQLADKTGVGYDYLKARLSFWFNIRYLNRKVRAPVKGKPAWCYAIAERGKHFVTDRIPGEKKDQLVGEINAWIKAAA